MSAARCPECQRAAVWAWAKRCRAVRLVCCVLSCPSWGEPVAA